MRQSILIVETDPSRNVAEREILQSAGFQVTSASTFDEAKRLLAATPPDILITGLRLGAYNGLHLVMRSRDAHPEMSAIVTSEVADRVLQAEASRQSAAFLVRPLDDDRLLNAVNRSLRNDLKQDILSSDSESNVVGFKPLAAIGDKGLTAQSPQVVSLPVGNVEGGAFSSASCGNYSSFDFLT